MIPFPRAANLREVRHIGIENELFVTNDYERNSAAIPRDALAKMKRTKLYQYDSTDSGAREMVTEPISIKALHEKQGERALTEYYATVKTFARVSRTNGTHLHISILNSDHPNMESNALALSVAFFNEFQKIAGRKSNWAQRPTYRSCDDAKASVTGLRYYNSTGARLYSRQYFILTPSGHGTLEFRGPKGTMNHEEILAWAEFLENIVKVSNQESVHGVQFKQLLEGERISKYVKNIAVRRRIGIRAMNKKLDKDKLF